MTSSDDPRGRANTGPGRFIPREELKSFSAWTPGALGNGAGGAPQSAAEKAAAAQAAAQELHAARQAGYQDGYRDGLTALESFKQSFARATTERVAAIATKFDHELLALEERIAAAVADCATQIARHAVRDELKHHPELIAKVAQEAVQTVLLSARHITVRLHPEDVALVADGVRETLTARGAKLVSDGKIERGGCRVLSDIGSVDATVETRWQMACAALGGELPLGAIERDAIVLETRQDDAT